MTTDAWLIVGVIWGICAIVGAVLANARHMPPLNGFILGLILGPFGVLLAAVQKPAKPVSWDR